MTFSEFGGRALGAHQTGQRVDASALSATGISTRLPSLMKRFTSTMLVASALSVCGASAAPIQESSTTFVDEGPVRLSSKSRAGGNPLRETYDDQRLSDDTPRNGTERNTNRTRQRNEFGRPNPRNVYGDRYYVPSDFERFVQRAVGDLDTGAPEIRRFGAELMTPDLTQGPVLSQDSTAQAITQESNTPIPADYVIGVGDEIQLTTWGSVDADLRLTVDRAGRITVPRVGPIMVAGIRYSELRQVIDQRFALVFKNYQVSATLGRLRSIRVYVTGFTQRPGAYSVSSLATMVNALMRSGGPTAAGSFRQIELRRGGKLISVFDFYDLLLKGDKSKDRVLQSEDVVHIAAVGPQVALIGSVNKPAIFELKSQESLADLLAMAGGFTAVADRSRLTIEHLSTRNEGRIAELTLPADASQLPRSGDIVRAFSAVEAALPQQKQFKRVKVEGEVLRPGEYVLPPNSTLNDAIKAAGGMTPGAYVFGTDFSRESVRVSQQENYERALRDLETEFTRNTTTQKALSADEATAQATRSQNSVRLLDRLRAVRPTGRIVLQLSPTGSELPDLAVEDGDRLLVPPRPTTVGVFGSVFNGGSYLHKRGMAIEDVLRMAGGATRGADSSSMFVVRANGSVISARQRSSGWLGGNSGLDSTLAEPGDTIFVPEELNKTTFAQDAREWTTILYQFGIGAAALKNLTN